MKALFGQAGLLLMKIDGKPALDLLEEAVNLLRRCPSRWLAAYYVGAMPFVLALLYYWFDMSRSAFAREHIVEGALLVSVLYLWMKCWQAAFASRLLAVIRGSDPPPWLPSRLFRLAANQLILQPLGLFLRPMAFLLILPYGRVRAYFENLTALDDGSTDAKTLRHLAFSQALLWPRQHYAALWVLMLVGGVVFLNIAIVILQIPLILNTFLGLETSFSRSWLSQINTTLFINSCGLAFLCIDPLAKAFYVLRCFYGRSLVSGEDLKVELDKTANATYSAALVQ